MHKKLYEDLKELLCDQMKKIAKKSDITPQELDNVYKAIDVLKDIQTMEAMEEYGSEGGYSKEGGYSQRRGVPGTGRGMSRDYSEHYPVYPMYFDNHTEGSYDGASYAPIWNADKEMDEHHKMKSNADSSNDYSERRGRDARTGKYVSRDSSYRNYSNRAEEKEHMLDRLENMMEDASSEKERRAIEQCIERISR